MVNFSEFRIVSNIGAFYLKKKRLGSTSVSVFWNKKSTIPIFDISPYTYNELVAKIKLYTLFS